MKLGDLRGEEGGSFQHPNLYSKNSSGTVVLVVIGTRVMLSPTLWLSDENQGEIIKWASDELHSAFSESGVVIQ